jgi:hypothetical protein
MSGADTDYKDFSAKKRAYRQKFAAGSENNKKSLV